MTQRNWTVAEAKCKLEDIVDRAIDEGPQTIVRNGHAAVVIVGAEEWRRKTKRVGNLAEFFARSPLRRSKLKLRKKGI